MMADTVIATPTANVKTSLIPRPIAPPFCCPSGVAARRYPANAPRVGGRQKGMPERADGDEEHARGGPYRYHIECFACSLLRSVEPLDGDLVQVTNNTSVAAWQTRARRSRPAVVLELSHRQSRARALPRLTVPSSRAAIVARHRWRSRIARSNLLCGVPGWSSAADRWGDGSGRNSKHPTCGRRGSAAALGRPKMTKRPNCPV